MTLGAGALARPLTIADATSLHLGWALMIAALATVLIASAKGRIDRRGAVALLGLYPVFLVVLVAAT